MQESNYLRQLRALIAVYEEGSIAQGACRILRTPNALASSIRLLEGRFMATFFERQSSGMAATVFGHAAYKRAHRIASELAVGSRELAPYGANVNAPIFSMLVGERHLNALVRLHDMKHMPSVAHLIGLSQPRLSTLLRGIEESLHIELFRRTSKGMAVTEVGDILIFRLRRVLAEIRHLEADIAQLRGEFAGRIQFAALPSMRTRILPQAIAMLVRNHPQIQISMIDAPFEVLFAGVNSGEIDFILTGLSPEYTTRDFDIRVIGRDRLAVVVRAGHPLCKEDRTSIAALTNYPWILRDRGAPTRELLNDMFRRIGLESPTVVAQAGDLGILRGLLENSDVISAVSPEYLAYEIASGMIKVLDIELPGTERDIGFVLRRDAQHSSLCELMMQHIECAAQGRYAAPVEQ